MGIQALKKENGNTVGENNVILVPPPIMSQNMESSPELLAEKKK
jgi:hypothetical protein